MPMTMDKAKADALANDVVQTIYGALVTTKLGDVLRETIAGSIFVPVEDIVHDAVTAEREACAAAAWQALEDHDSTQDWRWVKEAVRNRKIG